MKLHERGLAMSKILIVEDEESIADIEKDYLELNGYEVEVCNDGTSGLAAALHEDIDMCILDIMLPGTDGFEICKQVREVKDIPIIMVSAKKEDIDKIRGLGVGADDYMTLKWRDFRYSRVSAWLTKVFSSASWTLNTRISSFRLAVTLGSFCRREPAAAFLGLAKVFSPFSSNASFSAWKVFLGMNTSPRTMSRAGAPSNAMGMERMVRRFSVTSSPTLPSPRVAPRTNRPSTYSRATDRPSIFGSTEN